MKDRVYVCQYYICHGSCKKGKDAVVDGLCQHCQLYVPNKNTKPSKINRKREKETKWQNDRRNWE